MIDEGYAYDVSHPFHIHGHSFYVVASERHGGAPEHIGAAPHPKNFVTKEYVEELNRSGKIKKNLINPPLKDNVAVPDAGFTILRFVADNVGYWLFHCHMSWHNHLGMGLIFKVRSLLGITLHVFLCFMHCYKLTHPLFDFRLVMLKIPFNPHLKVSQSVAISKEGAWMTLTKILHNN